MSVGSRGNEGFREIVGDDGFGKAVDVLFACKQSGGCGGDGLSDRSPRKGRAVEGIGDGCP